MANRGAFENLLKTFEECRQPNWDGYGARPVLDTTYQLAQKFLEALPSGTRRHLLAPNPTVTSL